MLVHVVFDKETEARNERSEGRKTEREADTKNDYNRTEIERDAEIGSGTVIESITEKDSGTERERDAEIGSGTEIENIT